MSQLITPYIEKVTFDDDKPIAGKKTVVAAYALRIAESFINETDLIIVHGGNRLQAESPHSTIPNTKLQVIAHEDSQVFHGTKLSWASLSIKEPRGDMHISIKRRKASTRNIDDPFTNLILDYFKSHLNSTPW